MNMCISSISWYLVGYYIAFDLHIQSNGVIGNHFYYLNSENYTHSFIQWSLSVIATTIVSGCVAERYIVYSYSHIHICVLYLYA